MKRFHYSITISAPQSTVWHVLIDDEAYRQWSSVFSEGSYFEGDWSVGSTIRFLTPEKQGLVGMVAENRKNEYLSVEHRGCIIDGVDNFESDDAKAWSRAYENYTLTAADGGTELTLDAEVPSAYRDYLEDVWPKALEALKELAEKIGGNVNTNSQMKRFSYSVTIAAPRSIVWRVLFDDETYRQWTTVFAEGSHFEGDWNVGSTIRFLTPEKDGMVAVIAENREHEFLSIEHRGHVLKGVDDTESDEVKKWTPAYENYTLTEVDEGTELTVDIDIPSSYEAYFEGVWPKALKAVKELSEK